MKNFEKKFQEKYIAINKSIEGNNVVIVDPENEYKKLAEMHGGKVITINPNNSGVINPFTIATEKALTPDEKENLLRRLLDISNYGEEHARELLNDMSFLNDEPEWKERVTVILKEYTKIVSTESQ